MWHVFSQLAIKLEDMITNLLKVAFRNFIRERFYTFLNVSGLAVGITIAMLITIFIVNELSYDRFHSKSDRIYRMISDLQMGSNSFVGNATFPPMAKAMHSDIPEVELAVRMSQQNGLIFKQGDIAFTEDNIFYVDPQFFDLFDFQLLAGHRASVLKERYQIVLTPKLAEKYFQTDSWQSVVGKSIEIGEELYQVTGIVAEPPVNSHFHFAALGSIESIQIGRDERWDSMNLSTYILLQEGKQINEALVKIPAMIEKYFPGYAQLSNQGIQISFQAQALPDIHLGSNLQGEFEPNGDKTTIYIFGMVALVVLILACVNFVNLTTARSANRAKEVGIRKVLGSSSGSLTQQFTMESILVVAVASLISLGIVELLRVPFNSLVGKQLSFHFLLEPSSILMLVGFIILLGILAGSYPSLFLAHLKPSAILKGKVRSGFKSSGIRNSLVAFQFIISIVLITCTLVVQKQLSFMRAKRLGFDKENVLVIRNGNRLQSQEKFLNSVSTLNAVRSVGSSEFRPIDQYDGTVTVTEDDKENRRLINTCDIDYNYLPTLQFEFVEGRNFSRDFATDSTAIIINERAADYLFGDNALGKKIYLGDENRHGQERTIVGIVKNFNFQSLKNEVKPVVFRLRNNNEFIHVRLNPGAYDEAIAEIKTLWEDNADVSFDYSFLDQRYNELFKEETKLGTVFSIFTVLGLMIASLGLLGLAAYMSEQRSKELSVRKVMGATVGQIVILLSKDFTKLILIAAVLAFPIAYYAMGEWLDGYVYRTTLDWSLFVASGVLVLVVALIAVSYQSIKAALVNPVESLRNE